MKKKFNRIINTLFLIQLLFMFNSCNSTLQDNDKQTILANKGKVYCRIIAGQEDRIAAESLQKYLLNKFKIDVDITDPVVLQDSTYKCEIVLGRKETNYYLNSIALQQDIEIDKAKLTSDGYIIRTLHGSDVDYVLVAGGGKRGVFYAVGELKNYYLRNVKDSVVILPASVYEVPTLKYRWLWTWDWRMEWNGEPGGSDWGGGGAYKKKSGAYLEDYKACIDYMSENGFNGLVIWGFIRDSHGGISASQEICRYADERGVRILPGIGTSGYGGFVFEGNHHYNSHTWLSEHPELRLVNKEGKVGEKGDDGLSDHLCPSKVANQKWLDEGAEWLFKNFKIGGVNLEMGDHFVCYCDDCKKARDAINSDEPDYYKDMALSHGKMIRSMRKIAPDAWLSYATYTGFTKEMMAKPPKFTELIPQDAICQWTLLHMLDSTIVPDVSEPSAGKGWPKGLKPMTRHSVGYLHWANKSTKTEHDFFLKQFRRAARLSYNSGLEGLVLYGELPISRINMKLNYLAFREYCFHPNLTQKEFTEKRLVPLCGEKSIEKLWEIIELVRTEKQRNSGDNLIKAKRIAKSVLQEIPSQYQENWLNIIAYLNSYSL